MADDTDTSTDQPSTDTTAPPPSTDTTVPQPSVPEDQVKQEYDQYKQQYDKIQEQTTKMMEDYQKQVTPLYDQLEAKVKAEQADLEKAPKPDNNYPAVPNIDKEQKSNYGKAVMSFLGIGLALTYMFGSRHNKMAMAGAMMGLGEGLKAINKGFKEQGQERMELWQKNVELMDKHNKERLDAYKETLANDKLSVNQQMDLISVQAQRYHDGTMVKEAQTKNLVGVLGKLQNMEKAWNDFHYKSQSNAAKVFERYPAYVVEYKAKYGKAPWDDPDSQKKMPLSEWLQQDRKNAAKARKEGSDEADTESNQIFAPKKDQKKPNPLGVDPSELDNMIRP